MPRSPAHACVRVGVHACARVCDLCAYLLAWVQGPVAEKQPPEGRAEPGFLENVPEAKACPPLPPAQRGMPPLDGPHHTDPPSPSRARGKQATLAEGPALGPPSLSGSGGGLGSVCLQPGPTAAGREQKPLGLRPLPGAFASLGAGLLARPPRAPQGHLSPWMRAQPRASRGAQVTGVHEPLLDRGWGGVAT